MYKLCYHKVQYYASKNALFTAKTQPVNTRPRMTYTVSSGTLNLTQPNQPVNT